MSAGLGQDKCMKTQLGVLCLGLAAAACGPLSIYYQPGVSVSRMQTDTTKCEVQALKDAPVANEIRQTPPIYFPGGYYCSGSGACWTRPGYWGGGQIYTVDTNRNLRARVLDLCMADRGYQPVSIPPCSQSVKNKAAPGRTTTLPDLTAGSCFIRNEDKTYQIVNVAPEQ